MTKPTKNAKEAGLSAAAVEKVKGLKHWQILQKSFDPVSYTHLILERAKDDLTVALRKQ